MVKLPTPNDHLFDNRTLKRNLQRGLITEKQYQSYLKSLPDDSAGVENVPIWSDDLIPPSKRLKNRPASPPAETPALPAANLDGPETYEDTPAPAVLETPKSL